MQRVKYILSLFVWLIYKIHFFLYKFHQKIRNNIDIMPGSIVSMDSAIGQYTYIWHNTFITKAIIWRYCSIAPNVSIGMWEHNVDAISTNSIFYDSSYDELTKKDCIVWNDVWIWVGSIIRRGVTIGNGAIIWANSFVNKNVEPYSIVAGNPAKLIRYRFNGDEIKNIEKSQWWLYEPTQAISIFKNI